MDLVSSRVVSNPDGFATLHHGTRGYTSERARVQALVLPQPRFMGIAWFMHFPGPAWPTRPTSWMRHSYRFAPV